MYSGKYITESINNYGESMIPEYINYRDYQGLRRERGKQNFDGSKFLKF